MSKGRKNCLCTAMLFDPAEAEAKIKQAEAKTATVVTPEGELVTPSRRVFNGKEILFERWLRFKQFVLLKPFRRKDNGLDDASEKKRSLLSIFFW
jgi:hypothetical protein